MIKNDFTPDKSLMVDINQRPCTQALFLELGYDVRWAMYTLKELDYTYKGKVYPSLKRLFLAMDDPTEYEFATKYLLSWNHWKRITENKQLAPYVAEWRDELELKLRSRAIRDIQALCESENGNYQAAKFLADKGWDKRQAGRPSKAEREKQAAIAEHIKDEFESDVARMDDYRKV